MRERLANSLLLFSWPLLLTVLVNAGCTRSSDRIKDRVVVKLGDVTLTAGDFAKSLARKLKEYNALSVKDPAVLKRIKEEVVAEFVVMALTKNYAEKNKLFVRQEDVEKEINNYRKGYPDDLTFRKALAEENLSIKEWEEKVRYSQLQRLVIDHIGSGLALPTDAELQSYYEANKSRFKQKEAVKLRQIIMPREADAKRILEDLSKGGSFDKLAKQFSHGPEASLGGDIGWIERGSFDIFDRAFNMKPGQRSVVLKSPFGYHIYEVIAKRPARVAPLIEVKKYLEQSLVENRKQARYGAWLEEQTRSMHVFRDDELLQAVQVETKGQVQ